MNVGVDSKLFRFVKVPDRGEVVALALGTLGEADAG
jgi:hypothetical protein